MAYIMCVLCGMNFPGSEVNRHGECRECVDNADHLTSEGWDPF
jgi:hypothetical protein